ncbi:hypothetical protein [Promicromonospora iranensis]|uniref:Resolvase-like protein n=1 Tax=Promicromonospora iranensis TaxID=1105144 RepID=A0ABU2CJR7_9MICO|nr:hypothetical protein [Promicromonospora iranensis]MDR7381568.1 hypothetical protein [Promicromonospora iranensis]
MAEAGQTDATKIPLGCNVYVDETKARGYVLAVVFVPPRDVHKLRAALLQLRARGSRSIHFHKANNSQRAAVIETLTAHGTNAVIITNRTHPKKRPREASIRALAQQALHREASLIVLERDQTVERSDRRWLFEELSKTSVRYEHRDRSMHSHSRPTDARQREARATRLIGQAPGLTSQGYCPSRSPRYGRLDVVQAAAFLAEPVAVPAHHGTCCGISPGEER